MPTGGNLPGEGTAESKTPLGKSVILPEVERKASANVMLKTKGIDLFDLIEKQGGKITPKVMAMLNELDPNEIWKEKKNILAGYIRSNIPAAEKAIAQAEIKLMDSLKDAEIKKAKENIKIANARGMSDEKITELLQIVLNLGMDITYSDLGWTPKAKQRR